jgi:16S rRNA (adenine1518-N6/adenine1519-N6)-dimethyltransferase
LPLSGELKAAEEPTACKVPKFQLNYDSPLALKAFMQERNIGARKKYGQNFLINPSARKKLIDALGISAGDEVWELGPGLGAMTDGLLAGGAKIRAFEIDAGFIRILKEFFGENRNFTLVEGDALKTWPEMNRPDKQRIQDRYFLGNLPYNIAAELLGNFIEGKCFFTRMVVTVQKEIGLRICARPSSPDYSSFTVLCSSVYKARPLTLLKAASFYPAPHVDSLAVVMDLRTDRDPYAYPELLYPLVRHLFGFRRKTIRNSLQRFMVSCMGAEESGAIHLDILESAGLDKDERPENIDLDGFVRLARAAALVRGNWVKGLKNAGGLHDKE